MTQQEVASSPDVISGRLTIFGESAYALIDPGATHSFIASSFTSCILREKSVMNQGLVVDMPVGESVVCRHIYLGCELELGGQKLEVDLVPLPLQMFDVILGMDFLTKYQALIDCYKKKVEFQMPVGGKIVFRGERGSEHYSMVSALTARRMMRKGCEAFLAYVIDTEKEGQNLDSLPVVNEFVDVFPEDLPGLPPDREIEFSIDLQP